MRRSTFLALSLLLSLAPTSVVLGVRRRAMGSTRRSLAGFARIIRRASSTQYCASKRPPGHIEFVSRLN